MPATAVTVRVPATSANLGAGFDCLGLALEMFASVTVTFSDTEQPQPEGVGERMVITAVRAAYDRMGKEPPAGITAAYGLAIPLGRGMGASAVARVAGVLAANEFAGHPLDDEGVLEVAASLEGHADNACPAVFGGVQVCINDGDRLLHSRVRLSHDVAIALLIPDHSMATKEARRVLPASYSAEDAVHNIGRAAMFVSAISNGEWDLLGAAVDDRIHQRQRSVLFPQMFDIFEAAKRAGAYAAWLSGAGSTIAAACDPEQARDVAAAMKVQLDAAGMTGRAVPSRIAREGASIGTVELVDGAG